MKTYSRYLNTKQIDNISLFAALFEYYISHDNRLKEDVKKNLLETNLIIEKMFDVKEEELESVSVKIETYTKQDIEHLEQIRQI